MKLSNRLIAALLLLCMAGVFFSCGVTGKPADPFTEEEYAACSLPEKIDAYPPLEDVKKDTAADTALLSFRILGFDEDRVLRETDRAVYLLKGLTALDSRTVAERQDVRFRGGVRLEVENPSLHYSGPGVIEYSHFTVSEPAVYGLFEKAVLPLKFTPCESLPAVRFVEYRLTDSKGEETSYRIYLNGQTAKISGQEKALSEKALDEQTVAFFFGNSMRFMGFFEGSRPRAYAFSQNSALYVKKDGETFFLDKEKASEFLAFLKCDEENTAPFFCVRGGDVTKESKELFRFTFVSPSSDAESGFAEPENEDVWYRFCEDGKIRIIFRQIRPTTAEGPDVVVLSWENAWISEQTYAPSEVPALFQNE